MADSTSKSSKPKNPNFYEAAAQMSGAAGGAGGAGSTGASSAPMQEKVSNVQALLEVFKKMDKLEQDAEAKALIQQMSDIAQTYLTKIQGKGGASATAGAMPPATGAGATPPPPPEPTTSVPAGAGAGMGA